MTRIERTETCYRQAMRTALGHLLGIMNPQDQISYGAMKYEELVVYARDWLTTECDEVNNTTTGILQPRTNPIVISEEALSKANQKLKDMVGGKGPEVVLQEGLTLSPTVAEARTTALSLEDED